MVPKLPSPLVDAPLLRDWVRIDAAGGITFLSGRVELGQGNTTALLQMVADELGVGPEDVSVQGARTDCTPNEGFTAGSLSIRFGGQALRWAASALRRLVLETGAMRLSVAVEDLDIATDRLVLHGRPTDLTLADVVAQVDLSVPVAGIAAPKPESERWQRFRDLPRIDLRDRLVGAPFVHDLAAPDMLFGAPVPPPHMTWPLVELDIDALRARGGVVEIVQDGSFIGIIATSSLAAARAADWARANGRWGGRRAGLRRPGRGDRPLRGRGRHRLRSRRDEPQRRPVVRTDP